MSTCKCLEVAETPIVHLSLQLIPESLSVHQHPCMCLVSQPIRCECCSFACHQNLTHTHPEWAGRAALELAARPWRVSVPVRLAQHTNNRRREQTGPLTLAGCFPKRPGASPCSQTLTISCGIDWESQQWAGVPGADALLWSQQS